MATCTVSPLLAENVGTGCGENAYKCYQCKRCTSGCPVAQYAGMHPATIMRAVQLGQLDMVFDDKFIWLCTGCETCTTRCPQGIDIAAIIEEVELIARDVLKRPKSAFEWLSLGPKMMLKGKINPTLKKGDTLAMKRMVQTAESITSAKMQRQADEGGES